MRIDVYDSYAKSRQGALMHFDVFVPSGASSEQALLYGKQWLESIGESAAGLSQSPCHFCHSEIANPEVQHAVKSDGYFILQMEGCPAPV